MKMSYGFVLLVIEFALFIYGAITISNAFIATTCGIGAAIAAIWFVLNRKELLRFGRK
ncbi:MAG: hypothetical protein J6C85_05675 [Alphaproteobacteria bacterium]|nr:hypothetical protein [Alphaproteobacteria bacterium]